MVWSKTVKAVRKIRREILDDIFFTRILDSDIYSQRRKISLDKRPKNLRCHFWHSALCCCQVNAAVKRRCYEETLSRNKGTFARSRGRIRMYCFCHLICRILLSIWCFWVRLRSRLVRIKKQKQVFQLDKTEIYPSMRSCGCVHVFSAAARTHPWKFGSLSDLKEIVASHLRSN